MHVPTQAASDRALSMTSCTKSREDLRHHDGSERTVPKKNYQRDISAEWERRYDMKYGPGQR